jgi:hypothetical protein
MKTVLHPWQRLPLILAGWINQQLSVAAGNWAIVADQMGPERHVTVAPMAPCYNAGGYLFSFDK